MKRNQYASYLLIGIGLYFFIIQFDHPLIDKLNTWSVLVIGIGVWLLFHYIKGRNQHYLTQGLTVLLIGIHLYGLDHFHDWIHHWAMFPLAWGLALFITYLFTRNHLWISLALIGFSFLFIFSHKLPSWLPSLRPIEDEIIAHFPLLLIGLGIFLFISKRK